MLTKNQLAAMLVLQDKMNSTVNPDWINAGNAWLRAAMIEGVEGIEHHGWKWWKAQEKDLPQLQMELVDIWHFALSDMIVTYGKDFLTISQRIVEEAASAPDQVKFDEKFYNYKEQGLLDNLDLMIGLAAAKRFSFPLFLVILEQSEMTTDDLFKQYVGKNVLNIFRQHNGYKQGTYIKEWNGREDNEYLVEGLDKLNLDSVSFSDDIYQYLQENYPA